MEQAERVYEDLTAPERPDTKAFESGWASSWKARNRWMERLYVVCNRNAREAEALKREITPFRLALYHKTHLATCEFATNMPKT